MTREHEEWRQTYEPDRGGGSAGGRAGSRPGRAAGLGSDGTEDRAGEVTRLKLALEAVVASLPADLAPDLALMRQLQRSEARYRALVTLSSNMVWVRDAALCFQGPCPDWERFTGQGYEEYRGRGWLEAVHPEDRPRVSGKLEEALRSQQPMVRVRYRLRRALQGGGHEWRHVEVTTAPVRDDAGMVVEWVGMVQDRTQQHEWESQRARQTEALARSNRDLEDFAFIAAHDLKEPLRGIRLIASFLEEDSGGRLDEDAKRRIVQLQELCGRMQVLLDSLLESAKLAAAPLNPEWVEVASAAAEGVRLVGVRESGACVRVHENAQGVRLWGDPARLAQAFAHLISNGLKYNESAKKEVEVGVASQEDGVATLYVRDNGIGVPQDKLEAVFRMFRRLHPRECYGGGAGAGLAMVKKIVERHGGRVWIESAGAGSTVYLTAPTREGGV